MQTILVTGHDGFIGSTLIQHLESKGYRILGISNNPKKSSTKKIRKDITKVIPSDIKEKIHYVIHLAAMTNVDNCQKNPQKCFEVNLMGTQRILEIARKNKAKFIFLSSSHVFGKPHKVPIKEEDPKKPLSVYGGSKLSAEILCELYANNFGLDISIIRLFSVFGKKNKGQDVISKIVLQLKNKNIIKLGNTFPKRDFIHIKDVITAISIILKKTKGFNTFNVGTGTSHSILDACNLSKKLCGKKIPVKTIKSVSRNNDIPNIVADSRKIQKLGWKPTISFDKGLVDLLQKEGMLK